MIVKLDSDNAGKAVYCGSVNGYVILFAFGPVWIGTSKQELEAVYNDLSKWYSASYEIRDGIYCAFMTGAMQYNMPLVLPWNGEVYLLRGTAGMDEDIVAFLKLVDVCPQYVQNPLGATIPQVPG